MRKSGWHLEKVLVGQYKNNVTVEGRFLPPGEWYVLLSILGDTADFGRIKKKGTFSYCLCLSPQEIEPGGCAFQLQTTICERGLYLG
jgi:hypothetical protein